MIKLDAAVPLTAAILTILKNPPPLEKWSVQGLGMMRLYLSKEVRLHIWDGRQAYPDVSQIHTHSWHFTSLVVSGALVNYRYGYGVGAPTHDRYFLKCGAGGCVMSAPEPVSLRRRPIERFRAGEWYSQSFSEIHYTDTTVGAVTLNQREFQQDEDHAYVFTRTGMPWVSAEPRQATEEEKDHYLTLALRNWMK